MKTSLFINSRNLIEVRRRAPWAAKVISVTGGYMAFRTLEAARAFEAGT